MPGAFSLVSAGDHRARADPCRKRTGSDTNGRREMGMRDRLRQLSLNTATTGHQWPLARLAQVCAHVGLGGIAPWRRALAGLPPAAARRAIVEAGLASTSLCPRSFLTHAAAEQP